LKNHRSITIVSLFSLIALFIFMAACDNNNNSSQPNRALSEHDFESNPSLRAKVGDLILYAFESSTEIESANKTGELGLDILPFKTNTGGNHTFCWEDIVQDSEHLLVVFDESGTEIVRENVNGNCQTKFLESGNYEVHMFNDDNTDGILPVFIRYERDETLLTKNSGFLNKLLRALSFIDGSTNSHAQTTQEENYSIFLDTGACPGCDLSGVDFEGISYSGDPSIIDLSGADLTGADWTSVTMWHATITDVSGEGIIIEYGSFDESFFSGSYFPNSTITNVDFLGVALRGVTFTDSFMQSNDFHFADLSPDDDGKVTIFDGADLSGSSFVNAYKVNEASFAGATMQNVDMSDLDLASAGMFIGANLDGANMSGVNLSGVTTLEVSFQNANFTNADLSDFTCIGCDFTGADFTGANTDGASGIE